MSAKSNVYNQTNIENTNFERETSNQSYNKNHNSESKAY